MHKDFHLYGTYIAARSAGFDDQQSQAIAFAAQAVDDFHVSEYQTCCTLGRMATISNEQQIKFWTIFHFLPTGLDSPAPTYKDSGVLTTDSENRLRFKTAPRGRLFTRIQKHTKTACAATANEAQQLALLGVMLHVFADSFAHENFSGVPSDHNCGENVRVHLIPNRTSPEIIKEFGSHIPSVFTALPSKSLRLGHGTVGHLPDLSWVKWSVQLKYNDSFSIPYEVDNLTRYVAAMTAMQEFLSELSSKTTVRLRSSTIIESKIRELRNFNSLRCMTEKDIGEIFSEKNDNTFAEILDHNARTFRFPNCPTAAQLNVQYTKYLEGLKKAAGKPDTLLQHPFVLAANHHRTVVSDFIALFFPKFSACFC